MFRIINFMVGSSPRQSQRGFRRPKEYLTVKIMNENSRLREQLVYKINQLSTAVNEADSMLKAMDSAIIAGNEILEDRVIALEGFAAGYGF